jgi:RNA polymerase sigma factor (sigma-70 family)
MIAFVFALAAPAAVLLDVAALYKSHGHLVWRRARRILGSDDDATDAVQDIFARLWRDPSVFRGASQPTTFLYAVTTNHCLTVLRNRSTRQRLLDDKVAPQQPFSVPGVDLDTVAIRAVLAAVDEDLATVAIAHFVDERSQDDLAAERGVSRRKIGELLSRFAAVAQAHVRTNEGERV